MRRFVCLALFIFLVFSACTSVQNPATTTGAQGTYTLSVSISGFAFSPASLTAKQNTKVTWTNNDSVTHTVTSDTGLFDSGNIPAGGTYNYTFSTAGTYAYHCTIHPNMKGTVMVQ